MFRKKYISEIFLTSKFVTEESWLNLINEISKLNGKFRKWKIFVYIEINTVRYFIETERQIPTVISDLSDFLLKRIEKKIKQKYIINGLYFISSRYRNILDIYDINESKKSQKLKASQITIFPYKKNNFLYFSKLFFEKSNKKIYEKKAFFCIPHQFLSINFSNYSRFFYKKDAVKFLDIQKSMHLLKSDESGAILKVNGFPYLNNQYYLHLNDFDFNKHSIVIGGSGCGKSKFISSVIQSIENNQNYNMNYKIVIIDPHSSMEDDIGGFEKTKIINFKKFENSINLFMNSGTNIAGSIELILVLLKSLIADLYNSRLERVLRHSICVLLTKKNLSFSNLKKIILNVKYRNRIIEELKEELPESTINFFLSDFNELKNQSYQESIAPIISFIDEMQIVPVFNNDNIKVENLSKVIENNFLTIFSLDQIALGEKVTKTIAGFVMQQLLQLIQARTFDEHIIFIVDEVAVVENPILKRFLSEARKYNLSVILAGQYFSQISKELQDAIFANVINYYIFRVSKNDARILESNIQMEVAIHNSYIIRMKLLTELENRECIVRISNNGKVLPAFKASTMNFISVPPHNKNQIISTDILQIKNSKLKEKKIFNNFYIGKNINLKDIMSSQSTGRRLNENG